MDIATVIALDKLSSELREKWLFAQKRNPLWATPCLHPDLFTQVARYFPEVGVVHLQRGDDHAFAPFRKERPSTAGVVPLCDYQSIISTSADWPAATEILTAAEIREWRVEHFLADREVWMVGGQRGTSPRANIGSSVDSYFEGKKAHGITFGHLQRSRRVLARDVGEVRFVHDAPTEEAIDAILQWKTSRFGGEGDTTSAVKNVLVALRRNRDSLAVPISELYAGDRLVAAHFGIQHAGVLHYWFGAFDSTLQRYSPGALLILELIRSLPSLGATTLDFGPGGESYKQHFANDSLEYRSGIIAERSVATVLRARGLDFRRLLGRVKRRVMS